MADTLNIEAGSVLMATPQLQDPNFERAVILITEHGEDGTGGFVLNRKASIKLSELLSDDMGQATGLDTIPVQWGGPVDSHQGFFLMRSAEAPASSQSICDNLYLSASTDILEALKQLGKEETPSPDVRFYFGYAGWSTDQLASEILAGSWLVTRFDADLVFDLEGEEAWKKAYANLGLADPSAVVDIGSTDLTLN